MTKKQANKKLEEIQKVIDNRLTIPFTHEARKKIIRFCEIMELSYSRFIRICVGHHMSYLDQLSKEEFAQEIRRMKEFD